MFEWTFIIINERKYQIIVDRINEIESSKQELVTHHMKYTSVTNVIFEYEYERRINKIIIIEGEMLGKGKEIK